MKKYLAVAWIVFISTGAIAGEKEENALKIQIVQEHIRRLTEQLYFVPFEKKVYEDALREMQEKKKGIDNTMSQ